MSIPKARGLLKKIDELLKKKDPGPIPGAKGLLREISESVVKKVDEPLDDTPGGKGMIQTKDCVEALAKALPQFGKAWKRLSKRKDAEGNDVREFQSRQNPEIVVAVIATAEKILKLEAADAVTLTPMGTPPPKGKEGQDGLLERLRANPIKVDLRSPGKSPLDPDDDDPDGEEEKKWAREIEASYSGRVIYDFNEEDVEEDGTFNFYCGPETKDGYMSDQNHAGVEDKLAALFADFPPQKIEGLPEEYPRVDVGAAESLHRVQAIPGVQLRDLWKVMEERLRRSGAVPMKKRRFAP